MKTFMVVIPGTTGSIKHYIPLPDKAKLRGIAAVPNSTQTAGTATVTAGKKGATNKLFQANLGTTGPGAGVIGVPAKGAKVVAATAAELNEEFGPTNPVEVDIVLVVAGSVGIMITYDEYNVTINEA